MLQPLTNSPNRGLAMIGRAEDDGIHILIYSDMGKLLAKVSSGNGLVGWTIDRVTVRRGAHLIDYDVTGTVRSIYYVPPDNRS